MAVAGPDLRRMGVVGAGGAGFPTAVKAGSRVEFVLANGAECEPLVHKDVHVMEKFAPQVVGGMRIMMALTGAGRGYFGIKTKNRHAMESIASRLEGTGIEMTPMGDFYPAGDEYELVYLATGRLIPPAGLPLQVGCVVNNVETLLNVFQAAQGQPVTEKFVSVTGLVSQPSCFKVPLGTPLRQVLEWAGGVTRPDTAVFLNGLMMGRLLADLDEPVIKTTGALIVLPEDHDLVVRRRLPLESKQRIGKSACDQCSYCTELCPRHLLGYDVQPHKVMRSLGFTATGKELWNQYASLCCDCGLCTLYSCPESLYPKEACGKAKADLRAAGIRFTQEKPVQVHPMKEGRRVPSAMLRRRLGVEAFESEAPYRERPGQPALVRLPLQQHVGKPAVPVVSVGTRVGLGDTLARVPDGDLGVDLHASIAGVVRRVTDREVEIEG